MTDRNAYMFYPPDVVKTPWPALIQGLTTHQARLGKRAYTLGRREVPGGVGHLVEQVDLSESLAESVNIIESAGPLAMLIEVMFAGFSMSITVDLEATTPHISLLWSKTIYKLADAGHDKQSVAGFVWQVAGVLSIGNIVVLKDEDPDWLPKHVRYRETQFCIVEESVAASLLGIVSLQASELQVPRSVPILSGLEGLATLMASE